ncbi:MAG: tyrosine-type recombinase/integrase [Cyanobacteriota bacterium]|nr:tyrosine-type recombinase/integrase [Cyanobacteriota bacterium]
MLERLRDTSSDIQLRLNQSNERLRLSNVGVKIEQRGSRLAIRGTFPPKPGSGQSKPSQQRVYLGIHANPSGLKVAEAKAREIGAQLDLGTFRWEPYIAEQDGTIPGLTPLGLWDRYATYRKPSIAETTLRSTYARTRKKLARYNKSISTRLEAIEFRNWLLQECRPITAKKYLTQVNACYNWAMNCGLIQKNPFVGMAKELKAHSDHKPDPFTANEVIAILGAFQADKRYHYYLPYVSFLFLTGARPEDAVGLKWKHINLLRGEIEFCEAVDTGFGIRKDTKTHSSRCFPLNEELKTMLLQLKPEKWDPEMPVFKSREGCQLNHANFTRRAWYGYKNRHKTFVPGIVTRLAETGEIAHYREPYAMRDTFISHCLEEGINPVQVAQWVGNSPEVIHRHYAGLVRRASVPELGFSA